MMLTSNFFPISFTANKFQIKRVIYSQDDLKQLRNTHNSTHSFFRNGDFIYMSPMGGENLSIGTISEIDVQKEPQIVSSLIRHIFFRTFREKYPDIVPLDFYPFRILSRKKQDDLLFGELPLNMQGVLSFKKLIEVQFRTIKINSNLVFGALINVYYHWQFNKNCQELLEEGFNILGLNVLTSESLPGLEGILAPDESLIGAIKAIDREAAKVESNEGEEVFKLEELYLHKSYRNIREYLEFKLGDAKTKQILNKIREKDQSRLNAKSYFEEISELAKTISGLQYKNKNGFEFIISDSPQSVSSKFLIQEPTFIFDYSPGATHKNPSIGLNNHGPYDSSTFDIKHPHFLVVCHKENRGAFAEFLGKLKHGITSSSYFKGGMIGKYRLHDISFDLIELNNYSVGEYQSKITEYMKERDALPHLAIIETSENFKHEEPELNPYHNTRAYFLGLGIPVQGVKSENIRMPDYNLQWIIESIALQIYAKLGGKPWVLPASSSIDYEIIVGIGSALLRPNLLLGNFQERIVGITTFFTGDGKYIFGNRCKDVPFDEYFNELLSSLRQSIKEISIEYGWKQNATIRVVFHIFKPIKNIEADVVEQLLSEFPQYNIQYCFVTVSDSHPYIMFDKNQSGSGQNHKGVYVPERGQNWILDEHTCLLQLKGPKAIKTTKHSFSNPVFIRVHEKSTYKDLNTVAQQVFNFTNLSWRGFHPTRQPVTILYSDLIAKHLSQLRKVKFWKPETVNSLLKHKKWFL
jgi:hypothetical protein